MPYHEIAESVADMTEKKNKAYGNSIVTSAQILLILYPDGVPTSAYNDLLLITRILDKISRIVNDRYAYDESPYQDIMGYALMGVIKDES